MIRVTVTWHGQTSNFSWHDSLPGSALKQDLHVSDAGFVEESAKPLPPVEAPRPCSALSPVTYSSDRLNRDPTDPRDFKPKNSDAA